MPSTRLTIAALAACLGARTVLAAPSTDIADYVLLAGEELNAKQLTVEQGDVAVNAGEITSHKGTIHAPTSRVVADQVDMDPTSLCSELFANSVVRPGGGCGPAMGFSGPIFTDLAAACGFPAQPPACDPSRPVQVGHKRTQTLPPGVYGELFVAGGSPGRGTLILEGGEYVFCNARVGVRARLLAAGAATVHITGDAHFWLGSLTGPADGSGLGAGDLRIFVSGTEARLGLRADLVGAICVPQGRLWLLHGARLEGLGVGGSIRTGRVTVRGGAISGGTTTTTTPVPTTTSTSSTTSTTTSPSSTSSTLGGTTSTTTTSLPPSSTTSTSVTSTTSTTGGTASTTSTSSTSSTSSTGPGPSTTSTSSTSTTSTSGPAPSTSSSTTSSSSSTSTSTSSTSSTTIGESVCGNNEIEAPETCDDGNTVNNDSCPADCTVDPCDETQNAAAVLAVTLNNDQGSSFGVGTVFIDYPEGLIFVPGHADDSQVQAAVTNRPTSGGPTCLVNDRDHGLQFGCFSFSGGFPEGLLFRVAFRDCQNPTPPSAEDFTCEIIEAGDTLGSPVAATCTLQLE